MNENLDIDLGENLPRLNQKTEDLKSKKGNLTFPTHTVNVIELNCKVLNNTPFEMYPLFLAKNLVPSR